MPFAPQPPTPKPLGVGLFSVRRELIQDFEGTHQRLATMGYLGVEPMILGQVPLELLPEDMRVPTPSGPEYRRVLDRLDLTTTSLHAPLPEGDGANYILDFAEALGTRQLVLPSFALLAELGNAHADASLLDRAIERFGTAAELAAKREIALGFHNHHFEWQVDLGGRFAWDYFWDEVDPRVNAEVDVYWAQTAERDPAEVLQSLGERARRIHLKDGPCELGLPQVALGEGRVDLEACIRAAPYADWHVVELDECATDMLEAFEKSLRFLADQGLSLART